MKRTIIASLALLGTFSLSAATYNASIDIDGNVKYQHVTGFGGFSPSPQWQYWLGDAEMDKLFGTGENQLGLNILRVYIANNKNYWNSAVSNVKRAKKYGAFVFASPWSPPASWKTNNNTSNGGSLKEDYYDDWATFLNDYYLYMKKQGAPIDAVSVQNEPDWNAEYESCIWSGKQMAKFLREQGSKIECKIIAPEAIHFSKDVHEPILNDPEACAQLDILGGHFYGWDGSSYPLAAQKGKEVWMTEFLINERQQADKNANIDWKTDGFLFASSINNAMLANMSAWVHYSLKRYYGCLGDGTYGTTSNAITKRGYILSHYAKYVSGTTRVRHSLGDNSGKLSSSAYLSVTGDSVVVMVINPSANTYQTTFTLPFNTLGGRQIVTTETQNMKKGDLTLDVEGYQPQVTVAPYSVNTYIYVRHSDRTDLPSSDEKAQAVFADGFDLAGGSCIPAGWRVQFEDGVRSAGNYSLGPRIMTFSAEGAMQYGLYFRTNNVQNGSVSYGEESANRLHLTPGRYTLTYSTLGWKATPTINFQLQTQSGSKVTSLSSTPTSFVSSNGIRINQLSDFSLDFEISTEGNYLLKWYIAKSSGGLNEALIGNVRLVIHPEESSIQQTPTDLIADDAFYDLLGRKVAQPRAGGIYIHRGRKVSIR